MNLTQTAQRAIDAYGGTELWQNHTHIEAEVSASGLAFTLKRRPIFEHAKIKMEIARPYSELTPIGKNKNISGVLNGPDVLLKDETGKIISERKNARNYFPFGRRFFYWDDLDMAYFANYAFWNYFTLPRLLQNPEISWKEKANGILEAHFPDHIPTHSPVQEFYFDTQSGLLLQHNYNADIITQLATAANVVLAHHTNDQVTYSSARRVTPRTKSGKALSKPVLIAIQVHSFKLIP